MAEKPWRLFVGAFPPPEIVALDNAIRDWKQLMSDRSVKWVSADKIHLTLCFLGNVEPDRVDDLTQDLKAAVLPNDRFDLSVSGLGFFPNEKRPRVFWAGVAGDVSKLSSVQSAVSSACQPFMESADEKLFSAHLTLARLKDPGRETIATLQRLVVANSKLTFGSWPVKEIRLIRSELGGKGSNYSTLASFSLEKEP